jgi:hypothetical protein
LPVKQGDDKFDDGKVNMSLGSPGTISMLTLAVEFFPHLQERVVKCLEKVAELCWDEGFVRVGNGLEHGITGNGYAMLCMYRFYTKMA